MNDLAAVQQSLQAATAAAEAACAVLSESSEPFARVLLRQMQQSAGLARQARDVLAAALLEIGKEKRLTTDKQGGE